jgi:uncharacterized protein YtpQ (UPF0354 family)
VLAEALLSPIQFSEECAAQFEVSAGATSEVIRPLELRLILPNGRTANVLLYNVYAQYREDPPGKGKTISDFVRKTLQGIVREDTALDLTRIVPVVRARDWSPSAGSALVFDELTEDVAVIYGEDRRDTVRYFTSEDLSKANIRRETLRTLAVANLRRILASIHFRDYGGTYMAIAGGVYEASLVLLPDLWQRERFKVRGEIVIAMPTRDLLLVTGSQDPKGLAAIRRIVKDKFGTGAYSISSKLYFYRNGKLAKFADE